MIRGTTPTFTLTLKNKDGTPCDVDLNEASNIYFTISQGTKSITKTGNEIEISDKNCVKVFLSQEETLGLRESSKTEVQLNWTYKDTAGNTKRAATRVTDIVLDKQLIQRVIE